MYRIILRKQTREFSISFESRRAILTGKRFTAKTAPKNLKFKKYIPVGNCPRDVLKKEPETL